MQIAEFQQVLRAFVDNPGDVDFSRGELVLQLRDEILEVSVHQKGGDLFVKEGGLDHRATQWLIKRIARLSVLADRILANTMEPEHLIRPSGAYSEQINDATTLSDVDSPDAAKTILTVLGRRPAGTSSVLYLTSDAGEGKTTLITHIAREQAEAYKRGEVDWLLVPIPLGGRSFLRFDDVVVAALVNRLRFQYWYFEAFVELVRLGLIVPAFDGFEEMFVESSSGEALSALASLLENLQSSGTALIAARKAYFEYQSFTTQARLYDSIGANSVTFARIALRRWDKTQFVGYARLRGIGDPEALYAGIERRLGADHPILTRAVLVRRVVDVLSDESNGDGLLSKLGNKPQEYFFTFVNAIIEREANEKWLTKSGETRHPLLTVEEHHELLCLIAQEMWLSATDSLKSDVMEVLTDIFCDARKKSPVVTRQVKERTKQHSLLSGTQAVRPTISFDHEDFRKFFLGEALGRLLAVPSKSDLHAVLAAATLASETCQHAVQCLVRLGGDLRQAVRLLQSLSAGEPPTSFVCENAGGLCGWLLELTGSERMTVSRLHFPAEALSGKRFQGIGFSECYFQPTAFSQLTDCEFERCTFDRIEVTPSTSVQRLRMSDCEIGSIVRIDRDEQVFDPATLRSLLRGIGVEFLEQAERGAGEGGATDEESQLLERSLRIFLRANQVNESVFHLKLGARASQFSGSVLPRLLKAGVFVEIPYLGAGTQRRFKLGVPMRELQAALRNSGGSFDTFLAHFDQRTGVGRPGRL